MTVIINKERKRKDWTRNMAESIKKLVKNINHGKDLNNCLPVYFQTLENKYYQNACIHSALEYYTLYEIVKEEENNYLEEIRDVLEVLQDAVKVLFLGKGNREELLKKLEENRNTIMQKMDVLTAYTDVIQIYEYVLNRVEYRFKEYRPADEEIFSNKVIQYIFQMKDNTVINENIKEVIGQLPVRMTKGKFFQLLKNSLTLYNGSDRASVETYLYMLRTASSLYHPTGMEQYFKEFSVLVEELRQADYKELTKEEFLKFTEKIEQAADKLFEVTDLFVLVQSVLNCFYVIALCEEQENSYETEEAKKLLIHLKEAFESDEESESEVFEDSLIALEGVQEVLGEEIITLEAVLFQTQNDWSQEVAGCGMKDKQNVLIQMEKLLSSSLFIELSEEDSNEAVTEAFLEKEAETLIGELKELFEHNSMAVNRAIMAAVLNKMPVFFESSEEVMEYIKNSLDSCRDMEEKQAAMEILETIMSE